MVLAHARALLYSSPEGATAYIDADVTAPDRIREAAAETLDLGRPVALILSNILGHVADYDQARAIAGRLMDALPPGSHLSLAATDRRRTGLGASAGRNAVDVARFA